MIAYFPEVYPDELLYSVFSRWSVHSGFRLHTCLAEELLVSPKERANPLFINRVKPEIIACLTQNESWEDVIMKHTMFPYYARFLSVEKKKRAYEAVSAMEGDIADKLSLTPNKGQEEYLRYCPVCVQEDREQYGETYWHRLHQISEIMVCPIHGCKLHNSIVSRSKRKIAGFHDAESAVDLLDIAYGTETEQKLAKYIAEIMNQKFVLDKEMEVGKFLWSQLSDSYLSVRGKELKVKPLFQDFIQYYSGIESGITKEWQISKVLHGERINPFEIAQLGLFFHVSANELVSCLLPDQTADEVYDAKIVKMYQGGMSAYRIAKEAGISATLARMIINKYGVKNVEVSPYATNVGKDKKQRIKEERKIWLEIIKENPNCSYSDLRENPEYFSHMNWLRRNDKEWTDKHYPKAERKRIKDKELEELDKKYLPLVKKAIKEFEQESEEKPKRLSVYAIWKKMELKNRDLYNMPKCRKEIEKHCESYEVFIVKKITWAIKKMQSEDIPMNWTQFFKLACIKKEKIEKCMDLLWDNKELDTIQILKQII